MRRGLLCLALVQEHVSQVVMGICILGFEAHDLGKMTLGLLQLALPCQGHRQIAVGPRGLRVQARRLGILLQGFSLFAGLLKGEGEVEQRIQVVGPGLHGGAISGDGFCGLALLEEQVAEAVVRFRKGRTRPECGLVMLGGFVRLPPVGQQHAEVVVGVRIVGLQFNGRAIVLQRGVKIAVADENIGEVVMGSGEIRPDAQGFLVM